MIPGVSISHQTALKKKSFLRFPAHPASTLTIHPRYKLYDHGTMTHTAMIQVYQVHNSNNDVVIFRTMTSIHVVPDRQQYMRLRQAHMLYRIDSSMIGTHQVHLAKFNVGMIPGVNMSY